MQCSRFGITEHLRMAKHVVLIAKTNLNGEINSCIIDGKLYKNKLNQEKLFIYDIFSKRSSRRKFRSKFRR
jgi:hypothetical protein